MDEKVYQRAEEFLPWNLQYSVFNSTIFPYWTEKALYYFQESREKKILIRIDTDTGKKQELFDYQHLLNILSGQLKQKIDPTDISLKNIKVTESPIKLHFTYQKNEWCYDVASQVCKQGKTIIPGCLYSPDGKWALKIKDHNLVLTYLAEQKDFLITKDGETYYDYASSPETNTKTVTDRLGKNDLLPVAIWSSDSKKIVTHKLDQRKVKMLHLLQNAPEGVQRPIIHSYRMSFSGDAELPLSELIVIDVLTKRIVPLKINPILSPYLTPIEFKWVWWSENNKNIYFLHETRASKELHLCVAGADTGTVKILISEAASTYLEPSQIFPSPHYVTILEDKQEIIWLSECSGYWHLYLYHYHDNALKKIITQGDWCVKEVLFYDANTEWLYFIASGYSEDTDPYYKNLFRCRLDGSALTCLTTEKAQHTVYFSPNKNCFLDIYSVINTAPISVLKTPEGKIICQIETANIKGLEKLNWIPPERFCVKARDKQTDIYGNIYFPSHFDPNKKYPIIDYIYPGPQIYVTPLCFNIYGSLFNSAWLAQALAEIGFIVIHVDGLGTPGRSKKFHDLIYQNIGDCSIPDHVSAIKQLALKYNFIDLARIGIAGYSAGGYAAARAMLLFPDFFKVAVAAGGNHDLRCYPASYGEKYNGLDVNTYAEQSNVFHAENLKGKLLLIHGEMDDNVHPCATMQLVDALIKHNKDFDMLIMPNKNHSMTFDSPYYMRRQWDYFVQHLLGEISPRNYFLKPKPVHFSQVDDF